MKIKKLPCVCCSQGRGQGGGGRGEGAGGRGQGGGGRGEGAGDCYMGQMVL